MHRIRSGRISRPCNFADKFPEMVHYMENNNPDSVEDEDGVRIRPFYFDSEDMVERLSEGDFYRNSYSAENLTIDEYDRLQSAINNIEKWDSNDQYQLHTEALK